MSALTERQTTLMLFIQRHKALAGMTPTLEEMTEAIGLQSRSNAHRVVDALIEAGFLSRVRKGVRGLTVLKTLPDDRFTDAAKKAFDAAGLRYSDAQIKAGRDALVNALVLDGAEEVIA